MYSLILETCDTLLKTNLSVELKLTKKPTTFTNFLHVQALTETEDPIWGEHGERIPAMVLDTFFIFFSLCILLWDFLLRTILAIYIPENQRFLQICNSVDWNWNECFDTKPLDLNQWHTIKLLQRKGIEVKPYDLNGMGRFYNFGISCAPGSQRTRMMWYR